MYAPTKVETRGRKEDVVCQCFEKDNEKQKAKCIYCSHKQCINTRTARNHVANCVHCPEHIRILVQDNNKSNSNLVPNSRQLKSNDSQAIIYNISHNGQDDLN